MMDIAKSEMLKHFTFLSEALMLLVQLVFSHSQFTALFVSLLRYRCRINTAANA